MSALVAAETQDVAPIALTPPADLSPDAMWSAWRAGIKGAPIPFEPLSPRQGLYRHRPRRSDRGEPARIWWDADEATWRAEVRGAEVEDVAGAWRFCHGQPITKALFDAATRGEPWPDEAASVADAPAPFAAPAGLGHNSRTPQDEVRDEIESADAAFAAWLASIGGAVTTDEQDEAAKGWTARFQAFAKRIDDAHKAEKAPVLAEGRRIDAAWITGDQSLKAYAEQCRKRPGAAAMAFRLARERLAEEARRAAEAERQKHREAEQARMLQAEAEGVVPPPLPQRAPAPASFAPTKATGLRRTRSAVVTDLRAAAAHIAALDSPGEAFAEAVRRRAEDLLKAGVACPGAVLEEKVSAR